MPANVGTAYVTIMPSTKGFAKELAGEGKAAGASSGSAFSGAFGKALGGLAKVGATAFAGIATSVGLIGKGALDAYADFEQLQGGVQKLFGDSWQDVMDNANNAYRTSGLSANKYMEQVTSFSSALVKSLGGDTKKAAQLSDVAMRNMADNVNVFGSNMEDVQNAFQGFAKQNYTMLDNLKLGYGGTKSEMQRLVKDAAALTATQEKLGIEVDANSLSFDNIVSAIAVMQDEMKIAGTTGKEAMKTISGSVQMAKSAWENWLTGLGNEDADMGKLTDQLLESIGAVANNIGPRVTIIGERIADALPGVIQTAFEVIPGIAGPILVTAFDTVGGIIETQLRNMDIEVPDGLISWETITDGFDTVKTTIEGLKDDFQIAGEIAGSAALGLSIFAGSMTAIGIAMGTINFTSVLAGLSGLITSIPIVSGLITAASGAFGVLSAAFAASPFGVILLAITAVGAALAYFFTQTETGRKIWASFTSWLSEQWAALKTFASEHFGAMLEKITTVFTIITTAAPILWKAMKVKIVTMWLDLQKSVLKVVNNLKTSVTNGFTAIKNKASSAFNGLKDKIAKPFTDAKNKIRGIINTIKGFFPFNVGRILNLKLPHISVSGGKAPYGIGGKGSLPSFHVNWYARGGIFDSPAIVGVGEAGKEAVVPIDKLRGYIKDATGGGTTYNIYLNDLVVNDNQGIRDVTRAYLYELSRLGAI